MKALVTGGGGFLGGAIVAGLLARGAAVRIFSRGDYPWWRESGVDTRRGDLADPAAVMDAARGMDIVFHAGAKAGVWGRARDYEAANVRGTEHVIAACRKHGIPRLVYTSSPSVVYAGLDQEGVNESAPYPTRFLAHYPRTKALAERLVLSANDTELATVALRPHLIWGEGDTHFLPRLVERARTGRLLLPGDGRKRVDSVHVANAALAHLLAADCLSPGAPAAGRAYFISQGEPLPLGDLITRLLRALGVATSPRFMPGATRLAYGLAGGLELFWRAFHLPGEPRLTRFVVRQVTTAHWFDISAARRDLGYTPRVSIDEGMTRLARSASHVLIARSN